MFKTSTRCNNCIDCNRRISLFDKLKPIELELLNKDRFEVIFKAGEMVFKQGAVSEHFISLTSGYAKIYLEGIDGKNQILSIAKPWQLIGSPGLHIDSRLYFSVKALTEISACFINIHSFKTVMQKNEEFAIEYLTYLNKKHVSLFDMLLSLTQKQMHGRIADGLLYMSKEVFGDIISTNLISRQDIADLTAMSKDSAIRILKEFEKDGYINSSGDQIEILSIEALEKISLKG